MEFTLPLYDLKQLSLMLSVPATNLRAYVRSGELGAILLGREYKVPQNELDMFLKSRFGKLSRAGRPRKAQGNRGGRLRTTG